jgi:tetratricopeptide (TPR) repeat protein
MENMKKTLIIAIALFFISTLKAQTAPDESAKAELKKTNTGIVRLFQQKKYDEALVLAQQAVPATEQIFGREHLETALALRNLGYIQLARNDAKAAEVTFEKAFEIYKKTPDLDQANGASLADMLESLAFIKYQKRIDSAENLYETALHWREKTDGADSIKAARSLSALANISYWKKDYKKSAALFQRLLEISAKNLGSADQETSLVYRRTECAYRKAGREADFEPLKEKFAFKAPAAPDPSQRPNFISGGVVNGKATNLAQPAYPADAKAVRAGGKVEVQIMIDEKGDVIFACGVNSAHPALIESTEAAAYRSKFAPTILQGRPIRVFGTVIYNFVP